MSTVGQIEKFTQARIVKLFVERLNYAYLGDWTHRAGNANIETELLTAWLKRQGHGDALIGRALHELGKMAGAPAGRCMTAIARSTACCATG